MKSYWDASAVIDAIHDSRIEALAARPGQVTRTHTLTEVFSTLTGGRLGFQYLADDAAELIEEMMRGFEFVELTKEEITKALAGAQKAGVRGGRVHDWLHAKAAEKAGADELLTDNLADFAGLIPNLKIVQP